MNKVGTILKQSAEVSQQKPKNLVNGRREAAGGEEAPGANGFEVHRVLSGASVPF